MSTLETIVQDLTKLPPHKLALAANYVHSLRVVTRDERLAALKATAGCMSGEEGEEFERLVREEADRVDVDGAK